MASSPENWAFPPELQPKQSEVEFDLKSALDAVVQIRTEVPEDAFTAQSLGTERVGNGVVIRADGLVLTIGYLITEATQVWLTTNGGQAVEAYPLAYDQATGFGLVMPLGKLNAPMLERGSARTLGIGDEALFIGAGGRAHTLKATIADKREFAGYWEYVLDEAIFTTPAHPQWGGSALVDGTGRLVGIGSLFVQESKEGEQSEGNMVVPIDLLEPILDDLVKLGRSAQPTRPWLGMYAMESNGHLVVGGLATGGPAERAGVQLGDVVLEVGGKGVDSLAALFRRVWLHGDAGVEVPFTFGREGKIVRVKVKSGDRADYLRKPQLH
jgi:S1-C subfamily serine protease